MTYVHATSVAPKARALAQTMAEVRSSLDAPRALRREHGAVTATELSALEANAYAKLRQSCGGCQLSSYPEPVRNMFASWLAAQMADLERQARIAAATRAFDGVVFRYAALQHDLAGDPNAARLPPLQLEWQLEHLAYHQLSSGMLLEFSDELLLPMLRVRYPQVFPALRTAAAPELEALRNADWMLPFDELEIRFQAVAEEISASAHQASVIGRRTMPLMVAFPKPGTPADRAIQGAVVAPATRIAGVWEECEAGWCLKRHPEFTILPEDVYRVAEVGLSCMDAAPLVKAGAFYAANTASTLNPGWNTTPRGFSISRIKHLLFPVEEGNLGYRAHTLELAMNTRMRSLAGNHLSAWSTFSAHRPPEGDPPPVLSPFGTFALELGDTVDNPTTPFATAHTIVAIFEIEVRQAASSLSGVDQCREAP